MRILLSLILGVLIFVSLFRVFVSPPTDFPAPYNVNVNAGDTLRDVADKLATDHVIRSARTFEIFMVAFGNDKTISEGQYYLKTPMSSLAIAMRISGREFGILKKRVTFPEGYTNAQMAQQLAKDFPDLDTATFLIDAKNEQGYLFPDTYSFFPSVMPDDVIAALKENYQEKMINVRQEITPTGHSEADIITMASIIEKEAKGSSDSATIAGILWKRIQQGIPLQVDAVPSTYTTKGLPDAPIDNPGMTAIEAAIHPVSSPYLYYLHDSSGTVHYASDFKQHQANINKYLK